MRKSITVKAESVEEAIRLALTILNVEKENVQVEILTNPGKSLFGLRKNLAEVCVTILKKEAFTAPNEVVKEDEKVEKALATGARIYKNQLQFSFGENNYPVLKPGEHVSLIVNGEEIKERKIIAEGDDVELKVSDALEPPTFELAVVDREMAVELRLALGRRVIRRLEDTDYQDELVLNVLEEESFYNDLSPMEIIEELKRKGIEKGYDFRAIRQVEEAQEPVKSIVARGVQPIEGTDGDFFVIPRQQKEITEDETVDFRELNQLDTVKIGEVIGNVIEAVPGTDGENVFGKPVPAKKVRDVVVRLGKNVEMIGNDIVAKISGSPAIDWRGQYVKIDVRHELVHHGDVDLASGNIRFDGNLKIFGNVKPSMYLSAVGEIFIGGTVTKSTVHSQRSIEISKNVFSSTIQVGKQDLVIDESVECLSGLMVYLQSIQATIEQVLFVRGSEKRPLTTKEFHQLIHLLMENKYADFKEQIRQFTQKIWNHTEYLPEEWVELAKQFTNMFIRPFTGEETIMNLEELIDESMMLIDLYTTEAEPKTILKIPYAINSMLHCSGNIEVTSQGLYHCFVTGKHNVHINGVLRGGELSAGHQIKVEECGSESVVKTVLRTNENGIVRIQLAYPGVEVFFGKKKYTFIKEMSAALLFVDENGHISVQSTT